MKRRVTDINRFSFAQMTSNADGKTSASGTMGIFIIVIGGMTFLIGALAMIFRSTSSDILVQSIAMVYAGALLLGYRKSRDAKFDVEVVDVVEPTPPPTPPASPAPPPVEKLPCGCDKGCTCGNCQDCLPA
jgi:hypothetical protein